MSDPSNKDNELDQYGVWVKKEVQGEKSEGLPAESGDSPSPEESGEDSDAPATSSDDGDGGGASEEISLDDFFSDDQGGDATADKTGNEEVSLSDFDAAGAGDGEISLDSFFDDGDSSFSADVQPEETEIADEEPLDMDLEFDDNVEVKLEDESSGEVDFDFDEVEDEGAGSSSAPEGTESVDFADFFSDSDSTSKPSVQPDATEGGSNSFDGIFNSMDDGQPSPAPMTKETGSGSSGDTEEIDLSDFGVDGSDDSMGGVKNEADDEEEEEDIKTNFDISVSSDDDVGGDSEESNASDATDEEVSIVQDEKKPVARDSGTTPLAGASQDDDFDVDSLLDSIEETEISTEQKDESVPTEAVSDDSASDTDTELDLPSEPLAEDVTISDDSASDTDTELDLPSEPLAEDEEDSPVISDITPIELAEEDDSSKSPAEEPTKEIPQEEGVEDEGESFIPVPIPVSEETVQDGEESLARNEEIDYSGSGNTNTNEATVDSTEVDEEDMEGMNEIVKQFTDEVASLKKEIEGLRNEVDVIKKHVVIPSDAEEETSVEQTDEDDLIPIPSGDASDSESNFFSNDDEMDDVALDGSELNNILGNAELSEESAEDVQAESEQAVEKPSAEEQGEDMDKVLSEPLPPPEDTGNDELMSDDVALSPDELGGIFNTADVTDENTETDGGQVVEEPVSEESPVEEQSVIEESPVEEAAPEAEEAPAEEELSVPVVDDENIPVEEREIPVVEESPIAEEAVSEEEAPVEEEPALVEEETSVEEAETPAEEDVVPIAEPTVVEEEDSAEEAPSDEEPTLVEEAPAESEEDIVPLGDDGNSENVAEASFEEASAEEAEAPLEEISLDESMGETATEDGQETTEDESVIPVEEVSPEDDDSLRSEPEESLSNGEEPLSAENISYLESEEPHAEEPAAENASEEEDVEAGISEEPISDVFNDWGEESAAGEGAPAEEAPQAQDSEPGQGVNIPDNMKDEIKSVLSYMDQLLESLPEERISQFAKSEEFNTYKKLFKELGLA